MKIGKLIWGNFEKYFLICTLVFMILIVFVQVALRYCFGTSLDWAEELARYVMLYQIWVGASYAVKEDAHLRITTFRDKLKGKKQVQMEILVTVLWMVFALFMTVKGFQLANILMGQGQLSPAMQIPMGFAYASVPVGCGLMLIRLIEKLYAEVKKLGEKEAVEG